MATAVELLRRLLDHYQEWESWHASGLDALQVLRAALDALTAEPEDLAKLEVVQRIAEEAPSARLDDFLSSGSRTPQPEVLTTISGSLSTLRQSEQECIAAAQAMDGIAQSLQEAATGTCLEVQHAAEGAAAAAEGGAAPAAVDQALAAAVLAAGVARQSALQVPDLACAQLPVGAAAGGNSPGAAGAQAKMVGALALDAPASQLAAYAVVWELQPCVDERALALLERWAGGQ